MDELLRDFLTETNESLAQLDTELVRLEQAPNDPHLLGSIFRLVHTIKGTCGFIGLPRLERVAHAGENVLGKFRDGVLPVTPNAVTLILKSIDSIKYLVGELEARGSEAPGSDDDLIVALDIMASGVDVEVPEFHFPSPAAHLHAQAQSIADEFGFVPVAAGDVDALEKNMGEKNEPEKTTPTVPHLPRITLAADAGRWA